MRLIRSGPHIVVAFNHKSGTDPGRIMECRCYFEFRLSAIKTSDISLPSDWILTD